MNVEEIFNNLSHNKETSREEGLALLNIRNGSEYYYRLLHAANSYSRVQFEGRGTIFSQIGIDEQSCNVNCKFCSLGKDNYKDKSIQIKSIKEVINEVNLLINTGTNEIFLMTTANFDQEIFLKYVSSVKKIMPMGMNLVANIGDFDLGYALKLKDNGVTGVYHICRLGEGVDTCATIERRIRTLDATKESGMELYYCVEPIGPEHTNEQIISEIFRAKEYPVKVMTAMKRVAVPGTYTFCRGEITTAALAKITAVSTLCVRSERAMGVHEPDELCLMAGANQIYAECGCNPRDLDINTEKNRGFSVIDAIELLKNTEWM